MRRRTRSGASARCYFARSVEISWPHTGVFAGRRRLPTPRTAHCGHGWPSLETFDTGSYHRTSLGGDINPARRAGNARKRLTVAGFALALAVALLSTACGSSESSPSPAAGTGPPPTSSEACVVVTSDVCSVDAIPFASPGGVQLAVDVYRVDGESNRPAVVLLGPGAWGYSSRDTVSGLAISLAQQGLVVFVGDVRLACTDGGPLCGYHYPAPLADVHSLIRFATSHGAEYGARTGPIGVFGLSSGAELALLAAFTEARASRPGAVVAWSAPTSFAKLASTPVSPPLITRYLGCGYARCPDRWRDASPIAHASGAAPPTLLVSSADDPQVPATQSRSLYRALHSAGATAELDIEPGAAHAQFGPSTVSRCADFLLQHLS
jgi:acetyl esterase/lipase